MNVTPHEAFQQMRLHAPKCPNCKNGDWRQFQIWGQGLSTKYMVVCTGRAPQDCWSEEFKPELPRLT